jgi:tRNA (adenine57-N1/adenine58-N1)-methyltransferase
MITPGSDHAAAEDLALLVSKDGKRFIFRLQEGADLQTHHGVIRHDQLIAARWGETLRSHLGEPFLLLPPSLDELLLHIRRRSQIIFPKDLGYILLRLATRQGMTVAEAGSGSGALTTALAWFVGPGGHVHSFDRLEDMQSLARDNVTRLGLESRTTFHLIDISQGFGPTRFDAMFLDLPDPQHYLPQTRAAMRDGAVMGAILPTANQVSNLLAALPDHGFGHVDVSELSQRFYKTVPARLRPVDRMVAHTGYLLFCRALAESSLQQGEPQEGYSDDRSEVDETDDG